MRRSPPGTWAAGSTPRDPDDRHGAPVATDGGEAAAGVDVRTATAADRAAVRGVLDAALLDVPELCPALAADRVLVAVPPATDTVVGVLVVAGEPPAADRPADPPDAAQRPARAGPPTRLRTADRHVLAVAVRPGRRGSGIGSALLCAAGERWGALSAAYRPALAAFYERCGFRPTATLADGRTVAVAPSPGAVD